MRIRRVGIVLAATVVAVTVAGVGTATATGGGGCQLQGVANLTPPLTSSSGSFTYNFTGNLTGCKSNVSPAPQSGNVSAGIQLSESVTLTNLSTGQQITGTVRYQEPVPSGTGSCGSSTTSGEALATWDDGHHTVTDYTTTGALAGVNLQGTVVGSMTLSLVTSSVPAGYSAPSTYNIASDEPLFNVGDGALGVLTFSPTTQDQNCVTVGVSSANINGFIGIGSA